MPLELHHINGIHKDNRLENLQILCPNCHALTENYSGKSSNKVLSA
ncbi:HNH endonuclease [Lachnospira sp.]